MLAELPAASAKSRPVARCTRRARSVVRLAAACALGNSHRNPSASAAAVRVRPPEGHGRSEPRTVFHFDGKVSYPYDRYGYRIA